MLVRHLDTQAGFTIVELVLACVIFPIVVIGVAGAFDAVRNAYTAAKELNEIYAVLSACPELDRALDYTSLTNTTNCAPNNTFTAEGGSGITYSYNPSLSITDTSSLSPSDALQSIPDSKVVDISVGYRKISAPTLQLRMLITRNGIAQQ